MSNLNDDPRIDPRIKAIMGSMPLPTSKDVESREQLLESIESAPSPTETLQ